MRCMRAWVVADEGCALHARVGSTLALTGPVAALTAAIHPP